MKSIRIILSLMLTLFIAGKASSQLSLVVFSENGEKFTAYVNNSQRNDNPASHVETDRPGGPSFKLRIRFDDTAVPDLSKTIFNSPGSDMFYVIRKSDKGKFILEKTSSEYIKHENNSKASGKGGAATKEEKSATVEEHHSSSKQESSGGSGCSKPMDEPNFQASREMISNAPFDGPRLSHAKSLAEKNCLSTTQIIEVIYVFSSESSKLSFAKFAYEHCYDPKNYDRVKDVLHHSSQDDLQRYIDSLDKP
jgi:hypothetical protein